VAEAVVEAAVGDVVEAEAEAKITTTITSQIQIRPQIAIAISMKRLIILCGTALIFGLFKNLKVKIIKIIN